MTAHHFPDNTVFCNFGVVGRVDLLETFLAGRGRWTEAVAFEVGRSAAYIADLAGIPSAGWMDAPIEISGEQARREVEGLRRSVFGGSQDEPLKHLGESQTLWVIRNKYSAGEAVWLSDDRETVEFARGQQIVVKETQDIVADLVQNGELSETSGFAMLRQMVDLDRSLSVPSGPADFWKM